MARRRLTQLFKGFDRNDAMIFLALTALVFGMWPSIGRAAVVAPALVLLWMTLPERRPFVEPPTRIIKKHKLSINGAAEERD